MFHRQLIALSEVEGKQGHAPRRKTTHQKILMNSVAMEMAPSTRQPLSGKGVRRITGKNNCNQRQEGEVRCGSWNVGSLRCRGTEVCEELRKRKVDICCLQEVRWRGEGARFLGVKGRRYKLWWAGNEDGYGGVGVLVKEELCEKVVETHRRSDRVISLVLAFGESILRVVGAYAPQSGRPEVEKENFYGELAEEWGRGSENETILGLGDFNGHVGKAKTGFEGVHGGYGMGERNVEGRRLLEFCDEKNLCVANTWFQKEERRKVTFSAGGNKTEIDFVLIGNEKRKMLKDVKTIPGELQHSLVLADLDRMKMKKIVMKERIERRRVWKLKEEDIQKRFRKRVEELNASDDQDLWGSYCKDLLQACDEVCGRKKGRADRGNTWWWNDEVKGVISDKKMAYREFCKNRSDENAANYKCMKKKAKKVVAKAMRREAEEELRKLENKPTEAFKFMKTLKREGKDVRGGRCIRGKDGKLGFSEKDRGRIWKEHMEEIMNEENLWDHQVDVNATEGPVEEISRAEVLQAMKEMKLGKAPGLSEVTTEMIRSSGERGVKVMREICQRVMDGEGLPNDWKTSVVVPIYKGKGDVMSCGSYRGVKLLDHGLKIVERILERRVRSIIEVDEMQCGFMPGKGTTDAIFILRRIQEEYRDKEKKLFLCFVDLEKAFDRVPRKVMEWALRKRGLPEQLVRAVMSLYEGAKTRVRVGSELSDEFSVGVGVHQGSVLSPLLFAIVMDVIMEGAKEGLLMEILYADDLVLMSECMDELRCKFKRWKEALERKGMRVNIAKTKVMVSGSEGEVLTSKVDPCGLCGRRVMTNSVFCAKCGKWIHGRCAKMKRMTRRLAEGFECEKCKGSERADGTDEKLCEEVETVKAFNYLGDRINALGGCEAAVTSRTRLGWMKFRECGELLTARRFTLRLKGKIYRSCVRSSMLYGSETWTLRETELAILRRTERAMMRTMCGVKLMEKRKTEDLMDLLGLKETIEGLARANGVRWYGHVLRREEGNALRRALDFNMDGRRKRGRPRKMWKTQVEEDCRKIGLTKKDALDRGKWRFGVKALALQH